MASNIDEILEQYERLAELDVDYEDRAAPYLKAALLAEMLELVSDSPSYGINPDTGEITIYKTGHTSKAELRDKLKEYFNGKDN